jgi:phosphoribosylglycinamide formyltransferase-1
MPEKEIIIFASGKGRNAENIIRYFQSANGIRVIGLLVNNPDAEVVHIAKQYGVPVKVFNRKEFYESDNVLNFLMEKNPEFIVLSGFLWLVPAKIIQAFPRRIINIHPALLPKFGGKGMFGSNVHKQVIDAREKESGITIHYVDESYDAGDVIFQKKCPVNASDTPESLAEKIHTLEIKYFPLVIESLLQKKNVESLHGE